jgi:hypothetical protein
MQRLRQYLCFGLCLLPVAFSSGCSVFKSATRAVTPGKKDANPCR